MSFFHVFSIVLDVQNALSKNTLMTTSGSGSATSSKSVNVNDKRELSKALEERNESVIFINNEID